MTTEAVKFIDKLKGLTSRFDHPVGVDLYGRTGEIKHVTVEPNGIVTEDVFSQIATTTNGDRQKQVVSNERLAGPDFTLKNQVPAPTEETTKQTQRAFKVVD